MSFRRFGLGLLLLALLGGCTSIPFEQPVLAPTRELSAAQLLVFDWRKEPAVWHIRQSGLFELRGMRLAMEGFLEFDTGAGRIRLLAFQGLGPKLFDLTVTAEAVDVHWLLPDLRKQPRLAEAIAASVRRIFLVPRPAPDDRLEIKKREYRLLRTGKARIEFTFGGLTPLLLETRNEGPSGDWQVNYYQYRETDGQWLPDGILLRDRRAGYTLTLWLESVKRVEK